MKTYYIDTIGDNSLKGTVACHANNNCLDLLTCIKEHHVFEYRTVNPNLSHDRLVADVAWLYEHGAKAVELKQIYKR